jgi:hypothetical protein
VAIWLRCTNNAEARLFHGQLLLKKIHHHFLAIYRLSICYFALLQNPSITFTPLILTSTVLCNTAQREKMPTFQWVYSSGCNWIPFDGRANREIERLWFNGTSGGWIYLTSFGGKAYVSTTSLYLQWSGYTYRIARRLY